MNIRFSFKQLVKKFLPPVFVNFYKSIVPRKQGIFLRGNFSSWVEARRQSTGYDNDLILNKVKDALIQVKEGKAVYERDSVLFNKIHYSFPVLAGLLLASVENGGNLSVLDFGGSLGSSYFQCRGFLKDLKYIRWSIVEQPKFVSCGKELFEDEKLKFYYNIEDCLSCEKPHVALFSSVIQYIEHPYDVLKKIIEYGFSYIIFDLTPFYEKEEDIITVQNVPKEIYLASYPFRIFSLGKFRKLFSVEYEELVCFDTLPLDALKKFSAAYRGFIFKKKQH